MKANDRVLISGDTHGEFEDLSGAIRELSPAAVIVAGDFGYWHESDLVEGGSPEAFLHEGLRHPGVPVYFCDGNHENHAMLQALVREQGWENPIEAGEDLFYLPRGSSLEIRGHKCLFMGGAFSIDKAWRVEGKSWFPEEDVTEEEIERTLARPDLDSFDTVITHTCPSVCLPAVCAAVGIQPEWVTSDATERALQRLLEAVPNAKDWYFGHWHQALDFKVRGWKPRFHLLNMSPNPGALKGWGWRQATLDAAAGRVREALDRGAA